MNGSLRARLGMPAVCKPRHLYLPELLVRSDSHTLELESAAAGTADMGVARDTCTWRSSSAESAFGNMPSVRIIPGAVTCGYGVPEPEGGECPG